MNADADEREASLALVRQGMADFAARSLASRVQAMDRTARMAPEVLDVLVEHGLQALAVPEAHGGSGFSLHERLAVLETLACTDASVALVVATQAIAAQVRSIAGAGKGAPGWWSVVPMHAGCSTQVTAHAGGRWLDAHWPQVVLAHSARGVLVAAERDDGLGLLEIPAACWQGAAGRGGAQGPTSGVADLDPSVTFTPLTFGMRSAELAAITLRGATLSSAAELGTITAAAWHEAAVLAQLSVAAVALGIARGALAEARAYALTRVQFGQPIATFQAIQGKLANMHTTLEAGALLLGSAAEAFDREGGGASSRVSRAKAFVTRHARHACCENLQIHGGYGYTREFSAERRLRDARWCVHGLGDPQEEQMEAVAALQRRWSAMRSHRS